MFRRIILGVLVALVLVAGAATVGVYAYNAGVAQGLLQSDKLQVVVPEAGAGFYPYYPGGPFFFRPFGFGFGCFGFLVPLLFFFLLLGLLRGLFWHGPWGWRRHGWGGHGPWGGERGGVPPMFEEWHRRAHGQSAEAKPDTQS